MVAHVPESSPAARDAKIAVDQRIRQNHAGQDVVFVGIDLHKETATLVVLDVDGEEITCVTIPTKCRGRIQRFFADLAENHDLVLATVESVGFYQWFWDLTVCLVDELFLANAAQVRAAAGRSAKTDGNDATTLAKLLRLGALPTSYVPDEELRNLRAMVRHRDRLSRRRTSVKASIRMEMAKLGLPGPKELHPGALHKWLTAQYKKLPEVAREALEDLSEALDLLERQVRKRSEAIERGVTERPRFAPSVERLKTVPGVGTTVATAILAETGGLKRFDTAGEISCYVGLTPRVFDSADTSRRGSVSKAGPPILRKLLIQAAWTAVRCNSRVEEIYDKLKKRAGKKGAIVAIARKLIVWCWAVEKHETIFDENKIGYRGNQAAAAGA